MLLIASVTVFAQEEDEAIEELTEVPSLDDLLERPKDIKIDRIDDFKNSSFDLYDKVIETRKAGEENGWPEQGVQIGEFSDEYLSLVKSTALMAKEIKSVPKLKLIFATKNFAASKKAIAHSAAHIKYMRSQFSDEEWKEVEAKRAGGGGE